MRWEVQPTFTAGYNFRANTEELFDRFVSPSEYLRKQMRIREWGDYDIYNTVTELTIKRHKCKGGFQRRALNIHPVPSVSLWALLTWGCLACRQKGRVEKWSGNGRREGRVVVAVPCQGLETRDQYTVELHPCVTQNARQEKEDAQ